MFAGLTLAGAACVLAGTTGWGLLVARQLRRRPAELAALQAALELLRTEITYARTPLPEALQRAARGASGPAARLLGGAAARLRHGGGEGGTAAWEAALADAEPHSAWAPADLRALQDLGRALGASDADDQARHIALCVGRLQSGATQAEALAERHARMWTYLGCLGGVALVLLAT